MSTQDAPAFRAASRRAVGRLFLARWYRLLGGSAGAVYPAAAALVLGAWYLQWPGIHALWTLALVPVWLAATLVWAWLRRPSAEAALARWDEVADRNEMFVSAYCFESRARPDDAGEQLHLRRAAKRLEQDGPQLRRDLPARLAHHAWLLPLAFVVLVAALPGGPAPAQEPRVDEAARLRAEQVARMLDNQMKTGDQGLTPEEEEKLKSLEEAIEETAEKLRTLDHQTQRSVLDELEEKAHQAEALAEALDRAGEEGLSSKMLEELARHADTADFATALRAKDLQKGSEEAGKLADRLDDEERTLEEQQRIELALEKSLDVATQADKEGLIGKHLDKAHQGLKKDKPEDAAEQFRRLARQLAQARQRQLTRRRLRQLARQLRDSGQQIFGRNSDQIRRLAQQPGGQSGYQALGAQQLQAAGALPLQQQFGATPQGHSGQPMMAVRLPPGQAPIPGSGTGQTPGTAGAPVPGSGPAPIPGTGACPNCGGACQGACQGSGQAAGAAPVPGTVGSQAAGDGGHFAGRGSAAYGNTPTKPLEATGTGVVNAQVSSEGPSQVRLIDPAGHREEATRRSQELAIEFLKAEEEALADEPLPLSRRQQVLRYFTALRRRLVERPTTDDGT